MTYKRKNTLLWVVTALFSLVFYFTVMSNTIHLWLSNRDMETRLSNISEIQQRSSQMKQRLESFKVALGEQQKEESDAQQQLLGIITGYCQSNNLVLREYPPSINQNENDISVVTNTFVVEGDFIRLLKLVYLLEQKQKVGKLASVRFFIKKDYKTNTSSLLASLFIQNINHNEKKTS